MNSATEAASIRRKKGYAVESYFRDRRFSGAPEQSIDNLIREIEICAVQQSLDPSQMSLSLVNAVADPVRQIFLTSCSSRISFEQIVSSMRRHCNSETHKLQKQSEMDSMELISFIHRHKFSNYTDGLAKLVDYINILAPQLPQGFSDDQHKTRYLRPAVIDYD